MARVYRPRCRQPQGLWLGSQSGQFELRPYSRRSADGAKASGDWRGTTSPVTRQLYYRPRWSAICLKYMMRALRSVWTPETARDIARLNKGAGTDIFRWQLGPGMVWVLDR